MKRGLRRRPPVTEQMPEEPAAQAPQPAEAPSAAFAGAAKGVGKPPTKKKLVEAYLADHPRAKPREVIEAIAQQHGVRITPVYVSMIRSRRRKRRAGGKRAAAEAAAQETPATAPKSTLERALTAEREALVRRLEAIDTLLKGR